MEIIDKRTCTATTEFSELPIGTVFEFPKGSEQAEYLGICMKIETADTEDNTFDLEERVVFTTYPDKKVHILKARLVIEEG